LKYVDLDGLMPSEDYDECEPRRSVLSRPQILVLAFLEERAGYRRGNRYALDNDFLHPDPDYSHAFCFASRAIIRIPVPAPNARGNRPDAIRHFTITYNLSDSIGPEYTRALTDWAEVANLQNAGFLIHSSRTIPRTSEEAGLRFINTGSIQNGYIYAYFDADTLMDLWNNSLGIELGQCGRHGGDGLEKFNQLMEGTEDNRDGYLS